MMTCSEALALMNDWLWPIAAMGRFLPVVTDLKRPLAVIRLRIDEHYPDVLGCLVLRSLNGCFEQRARDPAAIVIIDKVIDSVS